MGMEKGRKEERGKGLERDERKFEVTLGRTVI